jgi:hypothetical protein
LVISNQHANLVEVAVCLLLLQCLQLLKQKTEGRLLVEALVPDFQVCSPAQGVGQPHSGGGDSTLLLLQ